jgi:hypothetical protein
VQIGDPLGEGWSIYKRFWNHLLPIAFVTYLIISLLSLAVAGIGGVLPGLISAVIAIAGVFLLQAVLVEAVADVRDGRADLSIGQTLARGWSKLGPVIVAGVLAAIAIVVGLALILAPGLYLLTIWSVIVPAIVIENRGAMESFGRSRELVRGYGWTVFGVIVVTIAINIAASIILGIAFSGLSGGLARYLASVVSNTLIAPFVAAAWTSMYFRLKALKEPTQPEIPSGAAYSES